MKLKEIDLFKYQIKNVYSKCCSNECRDDFDLKLLEQEHRFFKSAKNYLVSRKLSKNNPARQATKSALQSNVLRVVIPMLLGTFAVGSVGWFGLYFQYQQNKLLAAQNSQQEDLFIKTRKTELVKVLYSSEKQQRLKIEALEEFIALRRKEIKKTLNEKLKPGVVYGNYTFGVYLDGINLSGLDDLTSLDLRHVLINKSNFSKTACFNCNFNDSSIFKSNFKNSNFDSSSFVDVDAGYADFSNSVLKFTNFSKANLRNSNFSGSDLYKMKWDKDTIVVGAKFFDVINAPDGFLAWAKSHGAITE